MRAAARVLALVAVLGAVLGTACAERHAPTPRVISADELREVVRSPGRRAVVVNLWATWCAPCRDEMPDLLWLRHALGDRGLEMVLVSVNRPSELELVQKFLELHSVDFPTFVRADGADLSEALGAPWGGSVPATFVFDSAGSLHYLSEGKVSYTLLRSRVLELLAPTRRPPEAADDP